MTGWIHLQKTGCIKLEGESEGRPIIIISIDDVDAVVNAVQMNDEREKLFPA